MNLSKTIRRFLFGLIFITIGAANFFHYSSVCEKLDVDRSLEQVECLVAQREIMKEIKNQIRYPMQ